MSLGRDLCFEVSGFRTVVSEIWTAVFAIGLTPMLRLTPMLWDVLGEERDRDSRTREIGYVHQPIGALLGFTAVFCAFGFARFKFES